MSVEMKNLIIKGTNFEVVDDKARNDIIGLKDDLSKQKSDSGYEAIDVKWNKNKILVTDTAQVDVSFEYPLAGWS